MAGGVEAEKMEEEDNLVFAQGFVESLVGSSFGKHFLDVVKDPVVEMSRVLGKVFGLGFVGEGVYATGNGTLFKHGQDIGTAPAPGVSRSVKDAVKIDRVELPAGCDSGDIFVQTSDQCDMARSGLGRDSSMRYAKCAIVENFGPQEGGKRPWFEVGICLGIRFGKGLKCFVCAQSVTW